MKYCNICLQPDTRPNAFFSDEGHCPACVYRLACSNIDWEERFQILEEIIQSHPKRKGQYFDCIIGVSGGKDSTRQALWVRDKLGLTPLLVCLSYPPQQVTQTGVENISNLIELGFDTLLVAPGPETWRNICREGFLQSTNWARATELAIISSAPQAAIRYDIPLILWGENPGLQLGDMKTVGENGFDGKNLRFMNTVSGGSLAWLLDSGFTPENLLAFRYPSPSSFRDSNLKIVYLGWFWDDWSLINNGMYSTTNGLQIREETVDETGDYTSVTALDEDWVTLNQMIKYYKFGFGRVTDYVNEAIRQGSLTRKDGIQLIEQYDGSCSDKYIASFCEFIGISIPEFWKHLKNHAVNEDLFEIEPDGTISPRFKVGYEL
jgi:N-acetyl sugar amidotransferase